MKVQASAIMICSFMHIIPPIMSFIPESFQHLSKMFSHVLFTPIILMFSLVLHLNDLSYIEFTQLLVHIYL